MDKVEQGKDEEETLLRQLLLEQLLRSLKAFDLSGNHGNRISGKTNAKA